MNTKTQTKTTRRERKGHYEIRCYGKWERASERDLLVIARGCDMWRWCLCEPMSLDELLRRYPTEYRFVED